MSKPPFPPLQYLQHKTTVTDVEAEMERLSAEYERPISPPWLERWRKFTGQLIAGDELWYWEHFPEAMTGGAGYCIIRQGQSVAWIATIRA